MVAIANLTRQYFVNLGFASKAEGIAYMKTNLPENIHRTLTETELARLITAPVTVNPTMQLIVGEAGVGKSRHIVATYTDPGMYVILSPTGVSACSIQTTTIHSYFALGVSDDLPIAESFKKIRSDQKRKLQAASVIVIDECYMVSEITMQRINELLKRICKSTADFAGKQLVLVGDDCQLTSVDKPFIGSDLYNQQGDANVTVLEYNPNTARLSQEYRDYCNYLRTPRTSTELAQFITDTVCHETAFPNSNTVYYTNREVYTHNTKCIAAYQGNVLIKDGQLGDRYTYKQGMPIILTKNANILRGIYNGKLCVLDNVLRDASGNVTGISIIYNEQDGTRVYHTQPDYVSIAPAFAITIHKVQSLTLDTINICMERDCLARKDATKLLYVAMTRVRSAKKMHISLV